jgi:membrane-associated phospholipid phosphatase
MPAMPAVWFSELMHFAYFAYYPAMLLPLLYLSVAGDRAALRDAAFRVTLAYLTSFLIYIVFPVDGPHVLRPRFDGALTGGFFYRLVASTQEGGDVLGASFPSSHVAGMVSLAWVSWRRLPGWAAGLVTLAAVGVVLSTVYTQNHYAIDSVAGVAWALLLQMAVAPAVLGRRADPGGRDPSVPAGAAGPARAGVSCRRV